MKALEYRYFILLKIQNGAYKYNQSTSCVGDTYPRYMLLLFQVNIFSVI